MKMKKIAALSVSLIMMIGLFITACISLGGGTAGNNRGIGFVQMFSASPENPNWNGGYNHINGPYIEFDVTKAGRHELILPPWQRDDTMWINGTTNVFFLRPENPKALPVSIASISVNGEPRITSRNFTDGGTFWNNDPGTYFGNIDFDAPARTISSIPGYSIYRYAVPDINGVVRIDDWSSAGTSAMLGVINRGDIVTITFAVGEYLAPTFLAPEQLPVRPAELQISNFPQGTRFIALTFDDGPNTNYTVQILDELKRLGATASFFVNAVHFNEATLPVLSRMINEGHDVDNHSWNHRSFGDEMVTGTISTVNDAINDLTRTSQAIFHATGYWPFAFRAPFFQWGGSDNILYGLDRRLNMVFVDSGMDTNDWQPGRSAKDIADTVLSHADPSGGVILLHDGGGNRQRTVDSLALFIPQMQAQGYQFVSLRQLMMLTGSMPEMFTGVTMMPRPNQWVPTKNNSPVALWQNTPNWWTQDWWTNETPPWER